MRAHSLPRLPLLFFFALAALAGPTAAQVHIDYDPTYDKKIETFTWFETEDTSLAQSAPLLHSRIVNGVRGYLVERGYREVQTDPDVYVTYHTRSQEELQLNTTSYGYGYPGAWTWDPYWPSYWGPGWGAGMSGSTTTVTSYTRGTLIVDVWDAESKKLVWRGSASGVLAENQQKLGKQIDKMLQKMIKKWENMRKKAAKRAKS